MEKLLEMKYKVFIIFKRIYIIYLGLNEIGKKILKIVISELNERKNYLGTLLSLEKSK